MFLIVVDLIISSSTVMISSHGVLPLSTKPPSPAVGTVSTDTMQPSQTSEILLNYKGVYIANRSTPATYNIPNYDNTKFTWYAEHLQCI